MPTKKKSARSLKTSNTPTERARRSRVACDIISGLKEAVAFARGEIALPVRMVNVREPVDVPALRSKLGLSQSEFASQYGISLRTLQEWEQGRTSPDSTVRAYLTVIERNPQAVIEALSAPAGR
jgi:putative transcriptional regulator